MFVFAVSGILWIVLVILLILILAGALRGRF
jgi:hypothetical protein